MAFAVYKRESHTYIDTFIYIGTHTSNIKVPVTIALLNGKG